MKWVVACVFSVLLAGVVAANTILVSQDPVALAIEAGNHYAKKGEYPAALEWFDKAIELNPLSAAAHHNKGVVYHTSGQTENAIASFETAVSIDSSYAKARYSLALEYYYQKQYESSIEELKKVVELEPNNANAHFDLGVIYVEKFRVKEDAGTFTEEDLNDLRQGLAQYRTVLSINPEFQHAPQNAAIVESVIEEYSI